MMVVLLLSTMKVPEKYKREGRTCIFVGKGPSARFAKEHEVFGDIATVNDAALLVSRVHWSFWVDMNKDMPGLQEATDRGAVFVLPDKMHISSLPLSILGRLTGAIKLVDTAGLSAFPPGRTILYPYNLIGFQEADIIGAMEQEKVPMASTSVGALYILAAHFQYRHIRCLGFDGGGGYVQKKGIIKSQNPFADYTPFRRAMEVVASYAQNRYGTKIEFVREDGSFG